MLRGCDSVQRSFINSFTVFYETLLLRIHPISIFLAALLAIFLFTGLVTAKEQPKLNPQEWQINGILAALEDSYTQVQAQAGDKLTSSQLNNPKSLIKNYDHVVSKFSQLLDNADPGVRSSAALALGAIQAKDQAPKIAKLLKDVDSRLKSTVFTMEGRKEFAVVRAAIQSLGALKVKEYAPEIAKFLDKGDFDTHLAAIQSLGAMGAKEYAPEVAKSLTISGAGAATARSLLLMGAQEQIQSITKLLSAPNSDTRSEAVQAIEAIEAKNRVSELIKLLNDPSAGVRSTTARVLGVLGTRNQAPELAKHLTDNDSTVRIEVAKALGNIGAKEQIPELVRLLEDTNSEAESAVVESLGVLGAKDQAPKLVKLIKTGYADSTVSKSLGAMRATEQIPELVKLLDDPDPQVRSGAAEALGALKAREHIPELVRLLQDTTQHPFVRNSVAWAVAEMGIREQAPAIAGILKDLSPELQETFLSSSIIESLEKLGPQGIETTLQILEPVYRNATFTNNLRFLAHFLGGGAEEPEILMQWLGKPKTTPEKLNHEQAVKILVIFEKAWISSESTLLLRRDLAEQIAVVASRASWQYQDMTLLQRHYNNLRVAHSIHANSVQAVINSLESWQWISKTRDVIIVHVLFWLTLIFVYPKSPRIQALFFWNPWGRNLLGLGYVSLLLTWIPFLRHRLFKPFQASLRADAGLATFNLQTYFEDCDVIPKGEKAKLEFLQKGWKDWQPIRKVIPTVKGQIILQAESGLGKTMYLRYLMNHSQRIWVFLAAAECAQTKDKDVIQAIQAKLPIAEKDPDFLRSLIYSGAIDIYIDGLNEVNSEVRLSITSFIRKFDKGNIILTTQPLSSWDAPSTAKTYILQPLRTDQIEQFLLSRHSTLPATAKLQGKDYENACSAYLAEVLGDQQSKEELDAVKRVLSTPMDLDIAAQMLSQGKKPDLFCLQQQLYDVMATDYKQQHVGNNFPLKQVAQAAYQMRLDDKVTLPKKEFDEALLCMEKHKILISQQSTDAESKPTKDWYFRHDKIMDFFIVQTFLGNDLDVFKQLKVLMNDPRFRGVFFQLATLLPLEDTKKLREELIQYAADTKDHTVSDTFVQLFRSR